jgi:hypothetical protein
LATAISVSIWNIHRVGHLWLAFVLAWQRQSTCWQRQQLTVYFNIFHPGNGNENKKFSSPEASYSVEVGTALSSLVDPGKKLSCFT